MLVAAVTVCAAADMCLLDNGRVDLRELGTSAFAENTVYFNPCRFVDSVFCGQAGSGYVVDYARSPGYSGCSDVFNQFNSPWELVPDPFGFQKTGLVARATFTGPAPSVQSVVVGCYGATPGEVSPVCLNATGVEGGCSTGNRLRLKSWVLCNVAAPEIVVRRFAATNASSAPCASDAPHDTERRPPGLCVPDAVGAGGTRWRCVAGAGGAAMLTVDTWAAGAACAGAPTASATTQTGCHAVAGGGSVEVSCPPA